MMIFLKREVRESSLFFVVSEKIDPLKVLLSSLFFLCLSLNLGGEFFLQVLEKRGMNCIFFTKKCKKKDREERRAEERLLMKRERTERKKRRRESSLTDVCLSLLF